MNRMGVVGCGVMGAGIAEIGAKGGCDVVVVDAFPEALERAVDDVLHVIRAVREGRESEIRARFGRAAVMAAFAAAQPA